MGYQFPIYTLNSEGLFGPTNRNHFYKPIPYHNRSAHVNPKKSKWSLKQGCQYEVFKLSDEHMWECKKNKGLFSILSDGEEVIGKNGERLSFFPTPNNSADPWHGFPVNSSEYEPSNQLIDYWVSNKVITQRISIKILKGQL
jgi:hypothetical protein